MCRAAAETLITKNTDQTAHGVFLFIMELYCNSTLQKSQTYSEVLSERRFIRPLLCN